MPKVLAFAEVEDAGRWEEGFKTHGDLFRSQTINTPIQYGTSDDNKVAIIFEPDNLETFFNILESPATAEAMAFDGVKRETAKFFVIDKGYDPNI